MLHPIGPSPPQPPNQNNRPPVYGCEADFTPMPIQSKQDQLNLLSFTDRKLMEAWKSVTETIPGPNASTHFSEYGNIIPGSPCWLLSQEDGRPSQLKSRKGNRNTYIAHLAAFIRYGRDRLEQVSKSKKSKTSLTVSHVCGMGPRCGNPFHIFIEPKRINDERTHCHFLLFHALAMDGWEGALLVGRYCPHVPRCWFFGML